MLGRHRSTATIATFAACAVLVMSPPALAAAGDLDRAFGDNGRVVTDLGSADDLATAVAIQPDGKIIVVGHSADVPGVLLRYDATGAPDATFAGDGVRDFDGLYNPAGVVVQLDGKIVVAGTAIGSDSSEDFAVARFNADGTPDTSFGSGGLATATISQYGNDEGRGLALQPDGKIVVVGWTDRDSERGDAAIARFNADGTIDTSFSHGVGLVNMGGGHAYADAVAIQGSGKIVLAGVRDTQSGYHFALARRNSDGTTDTSFSGNGRLQTVFGFDGRGSDDDRAFDVAVQADGKIVAAGYTARSTRTGVDFALARYTRRGKLDTTFSHDGKRRTDFSGGNGGRDEARSVLLQTDGRILVAGFAAPARDPSNAVFGLARYTATGKLDPTFSGNGKKRTRFGSNYDDFGYDAALQADGRIVVAGRVTPVTDGYDIGLARYLGQ